MSTNINELLLAAERGDAQAQWEMAKCCAIGDGTEQNDAAAFEWVCKAAENGLEEAAEYVLCAYDTGKEELGIQPDKKKLLQWADKLSAAGSNAGRSYYARLYYFNESQAGEIKADEAFARVQKGADEGDLRCCHLACCLGYLFAKLSNEMHDFEKTEELIKRIFGWMEKLEGTELAFDDSEKADYWQEYAFALMLMNRDEEMRQWAKKAAPWNADAEIMYAVSLTPKAAQTKNASLFSEIAEHLLHAVNSPQKKKMEAVAYSTLADHARLGLGMEENMEQSYRWMCKAAELGYEKAQEKLSRYHKKLFGGYSYR